MLNSESFDGAVLDLGLPKVEGQTVLRQRMLALQLLSELADVVAREHGHIHASANLSAAALVHLLERCDALRKPARFHDILQACECDARGRLGHGEDPYPQRDRLAQALGWAQSVDTASVAAQAQADGLSGPRVGERIHAARVAAVAAGLSPGPAHMA